MFMGGIGGRFGSGGSGGKVGRGGRVGRAGRGGKVGSDLTCRPFGSPTLAGRALHKNDTGYRVSQDFSQILDRGGDKYTQRHLSVVCAAEPG